jgi:hypothetical protein
LLVLESTSTAFGRDLGANPIVLLELSALHDESTVLALGFASGNVRFKELPLETTGHLLLAGLAAHLNASEDVA